VAKKKREVSQIEDNRFNSYEMVYIISPELDDETLDSKVDGISQFITSREGEVSEVERWGKKKLAYPLKHFLEGNYVLTRFKLSPARCKELEANLKISEEILRHLLIKVNA